MTFPIRLALVSPLALVLASPALAEYDPVSTEHYSLSVETVAEGLDHPWGFAFISDDRFLVTERNAGTLRVGSREGGVSEAIWEAPDLFRYDGETGRSQAGLFDVVLHPEFDENRYAYVSYSRETERGAAVVVVRGRVVDEDGDIRFDDVEDIFVMKEDDQDSSGLHFGGRMAFDPATSHLYLSIGERRNLERAQDAADQAGSVLRMTDTGDVPDDNPQFTAEEGEPDRYIFSMGSRNIQALGVHPTTNEVWAADHGPQGGDEINLIIAGNNYGWPFITGGEDYSGAPLGVGTAMEGKISPVHIFEDTLAPSGLTFVADGSSFGDWTGDMLIGGLRGEGVVRVTLQDGQVVNEELIEIGRRIRDVKIGPDGDLWVLTEHGDGEVLRLSPQS
ncbi:PQQ-dependent sugar dehydrogenase [Aquibium carbonis]|nr:PQQ-dependent sugar dehydrogenase [Aquibium carbonis]